MEIESKPGDDYRIAIEKLRRGPAIIRKDLNKTIRSATKPAQNKLKAAALGIKSKGTRGGGAGQRSAHLASRSKRGKVPLPKATGLRTNIAKGISTKISYSGFRTGVRIRADSQYLPDNQKVLLKLTNSGRRFRHPVMGSDNWVSQQFEPGHWFDDTMKGEAPAIIAKIDIAAREAMTKLQ